jgi:hypothetical protein
MSLAEPTGLMRFRTAAFSADDCKMTKSFLDPQSLFIIQPIYIPKLPGCADAGEDTDH